MALYKIWGRLLVWFLLSISTLGQPTALTTFNLEVTDRQFIVLTDHQNVQSSLQCAGQCLDKRDDSPLCEGFAFEPTNHSCVLYKEIVNQEYSPTQNDLKRVFVYGGLRMQFPSLTVDGQTFFYYTKGQYTTYNQARDHCVSVGGYLAHIDSPTEVLALKEWMDSKHSNNGLFWIGATDRETEGRFVSERHGTPIDNSTWIWAGGEPNNYGNYEHCLLLRQRTVVIHDNFCDARFPSICEQDG